MATSSHDITGYEAHGSTAGRKVKANCMNCCQPSCTAMCAKCKVAIYCSKVCQKQDWPRHKKCCKKVNDARMPKKNSALTNDEKQIIEDMKARRQRWCEEESKRSRTGILSTYSGPYERIHNHLTPDMLTIHERPLGSLSTALHATRTRYPGWNIIKQFDNVPEENIMFSAAFQKQCMRNVLVAFMFMYHDNAMRHAVFLKDSGDNITHVEFYFDHLSDNPLPYFDYADATPGNYILLQNPLIHQFMDGQVGIRINDPSEVHICSIDSLPK